MDFQRALDGDGISGEVRHTCAGTENHHTPLFKMANGLQWNVRLSDLTHGNGGLHAGGLALLLEEVLQRQAVHDRAEHAHVIATGTVDTGLLQLSATEEVAAADHDGHLHALLHSGNDFLGDTTNHVGVDADLASAECLAGQLEQNSARLIAISHIDAFLQPKMPENIRRQAYRLTTTPLAATPSVYRQKRHPAAISQMAF